MNDRFLRACRREPVDRTPLWIMRQAGRYLPEYRELRAKADFLTVCRTPELAAEVTLQPLRRFQLDASIMFADIMTPLDAFDIAMTFNPGPKVAQPIRTRADVDRLHAKPAEEAVPYVAETLRILRRELDGRTPLIGFCGAPFTIAAYLVQGEGKEGFNALKKMMFEAPSTLEALLEKLTLAMADYVRLQAKAGAQAIQIFDSWVGVVSPEDWDRYVLEPTKALVTAVRASGVPVIYFANGATTILDRVAAVGADVYGIDWRIPLDEARARLGGAPAVQGNLDPAVLLGPVAEIERRAADVVRRGGGKGHIFNLGHGIFPETPIESVEALVRTVRGA